MGSTARQEPVRIPVARDLVVSGMLGVPEWWPTGSRLGLLLAHDVGENMESTLLAGLHHRLADRGILTLRFNFPFAEQRRKRPDPDAQLHRTLRAAAALMLEDPQTAPVRLIAAGFGLGARVAAEVIAGGLKTDALICLAYPLHPAGKPAQIRGDALFRIISPILFVQGTRDATCRIDRLQALLRRIGAPSKLRLVEEVDHSFHAVPRTPRSREEIEAEVIGAVEGFVLQVMSRG